MLTEQWLYFQLLIRMLFSAVGILVSVLSVFFGLWIVGEKLFFGNPVSGFATLAASITFLAGVQLLCLGIIAEKVGGGPIAQPAEALPDRQRWRDRRLMALLRHKRNAAREIGS